MRGLAKLSLQRKENRQPATLLNGQIVASYQVQCWRTVRRRTVRIAPARADFGDSERLCGWRGRSAYSALLMADSHTRASWAGFAGCRAISTVAEHFSLTRRFAVT